MKRTVAILLLLILILQCVPSVSAEETKQGAVYSSDFFTTCYANTLFYVLYLYQDTETTVMDLKTVTECLWFEPTPEMKGTTVYYYSGNSAVVLSALYNGVADEDKAADKLVIEFSPRSGLSDMDNKFIRLLLEYNLSLAISKMDGTDEKTLEEYFDKRNNTGTASPLQLHGGYWLTVSTNGTSYSYEITKTMASNSVAKSGTIYCPQCGKKIDANSKFCMYCGKAISSVSSGSSVDNQTLEPTPKPAPTWSSWSSWSTTPAYNSSSREVETRTIIKGYNMFHFRTQFRDEPHPRVFRDYSINGDYDWKYSRKSYGEKYLEKYVTASELSSATVYYPDSKKVYNGKHPGYQDGTTVAYGFADDEFMWFIASEVTVTEYRYRDLR